MRNRSSRLAWVAGAMLLGTVEAAAGIEVREIDPGLPVVGANELPVILVNDGPAPTLVVIEVEARPGLWLAGRRLERHAFELAPGERRRVSAPYRFVRMSPEASLGVRIGPGHRGDEGSPVMESAVLDTSYPVGEGNPAAVDPRSDFEHLRRGPLDIYAWNGSRAAAEIEQIARERIAAVETVASILGVTTREPIRLVFYPDLETKARQTGHRGEGWAFEATIVEVFNDEIRLDPYHELAHVLVYRIGEVPAAFDEGFAVYVSERFGADALLYLGNPGRTVDEVACSDVRDGAAFSTSDLVALEEIGSEASQPAVSYPQAASLVKHVAESFAADRFRALFHALAAAEGPPGDRAAMAVRETLGLTLTALSAQWEAAVRKHCPR